MSADSKASPDVNEEGFDPRQAIDPSRALTPAVVRLNEQRVERGFWPKFRKVAAKIPFAGDALAVWYCARDAETPTAVKGMMLAGLAYFVLPVDAIPDVLAGVGFTDDAAVFAALLAMVGRHLKPRHKAEARAFLDRMARER